VSRTQVFDRNRPLLFSIAYRMMGSVMDAEDAVQEAYLRWERASEDEVRSPSAYLSKVVTRLCIDRLRSARVRREQYVGPWLPEPLLGEQAQEIGGQADLEDALSMAFLVLLESLTPVERAVFLLREIFAYEYAEIASRRKERGQLPTDLTPRSIRAIRLVVNPEKLGNGTPARSRHRGRCLAPRLYLHRRHRPRRILSLLQDKARYRASRRGRSGPAHHPAGYAVLRSRSDGYAVPRSFAPNGRTQRFPRPAHRHRGGTARRSAPRSTSRWRGIGPTSVPGTRRGS
jgi:RNA polymerase sigma factor (sigma-70 family)